MTTTDIKKNLIYPFFNKSFLTNFFAGILIMIGFLSPFLQKYLLPVGIFALSGAITNWLAVHMLFEKIPFLYGSGVIPARFEQFKHGIKSLIMDNFFNHKNLNRFIDENINKSIQIKPDKIIEQINLDKMFTGLVSIIMKSNFGNMLSMFGGATALEPLKDPFKDHMKITINDLIKSDHFQQEIKKSFISENDNNQQFYLKIEEIVDKRLDELTPQMVKEIIQSMIKKHLGWLVVWGGVFGGLIGFLVSFF